MVEFNRVIDGLSRYLNKKFYANLNEWQEVIARSAVGRIIGNPESLKQSLSANGIVRTFAVMDSEGNVGLENLARDLKREIERKGKISVEIPIIGKLSFVASDIDDIYREITGGIL